MHKIEGYFFHRSMVQLMLNYDFATLSPYEFERLVRDLLQKHLGVHLESFKSGKDGGIDLRYASGPNSTIVQCKRYIESGFDDLSRQIKSERKKIERLAPSRYIIATSLGLLPQQKHSLLELVQPFCKSTADIFAKDDLNNLLSQHQDIERQHFKLWLQSFRVLEQLLGRTTLNLSAQEKEGIERKRRLYVQTKTFSQAVAILKEHRYCVITGIPGVGKTTLAEMLLLYYSRIGFSIIKVSEDIREALDRHDKNQRQIFYYDDFLGQTGLSVKLGKNEDARILSFIEMVQSSPNSRFIMTTREYILKQTQLEYERLSRYQFKKCVLEPPSYDRLQRARILYNHLFFSDLPVEHKQALLNTQAYLKIADHHGFNPRLIELMTNSSRVKAVASSAYVSFFLSNLSNPKEIWAHAFHNQISAGAKDILLVLTTMPRMCFLDDLELAFESFHSGRARKYQSTCSPYDFHRALKEIEETFLSFEKSEKHHAILVRFLNPSVRDFMESHLATHHTEVEELVEFAEWFDQIEYLCRVDDRHIDGKMILNFATSNELALAEAFRRTFERTSALPYPESGNYGTADGCKLAWCLEERLAIVLTTRHQHMVTEDLDSFLIEKTDQLIQQLEDSKFNDEYLQEMLRTLEQSKYEYCSDRFALAQAVKKILEDNLSDFEHYHSLAECLQAARSLWYDFEIEKLKDSFLALFKKEQSQLADSWAFEDEINWIESITETFKLDLSVEIEKLKKEHERLQEQEQHDYLPRQTPTDWKRTGNEVEIEIHAMFSGLLV